MLLRNVRYAGATVDIRMENGHISAVGSLPGDGIDGGGRWVIPGLWDSHVHFNQWTLSTRRLDVAASESAQEAAAMIAAAVAAEPEATTPFIAVGFRDGLWPDVPTIADLDRASDSRPIVAVSADLHAVWLNTPALALYGHAGDTTGVFREDPAFEITRRIDEVDDSILDGWARSAAKAAASRGVVGIIDYEMDWNLTRWQRRIDAGATELRVEFGIYTEHLDRAIAEGLRTGDRIGDLLSVGGYKVLTDGSLNTRTAFCFDEYPDRDGHSHPHGMLTVPPEELLPHLRRAVAAGLAPCVHAIGDHANTLALDAFEQLGVGGRIEHAQLLAAADLPRFARLGVIASVQPEHAMDDRDVADHYWRGRTNRSFPLRSLLDSGATLAFGSDAPVAPLDPWVTMAAAIGRARDGREPWHPEQAVTFAEALAASSRTTVEVGQPADLVLVERDPATASVEELRSMVVAATLLGGRFTHTTL